MLDEVGPIQPFYIFLLYICSQNQVRLDPNHGFNNWYFFSAKIGQLNLDYVSKNQPRFRVYLLIQDQILQIIPYVSCKRIFLLK